MRGMSGNEMAAVYQPTIERANQIFKFMRSQSRKNNYHQATQQLMVSVLGGNFAQYMNPIRYLMGKNALIIYKSGPPMVFALVDNSGFWQAHEVTVGRLEDRGQCNGITKAGERCKVGQKTSSVLYVSWRDRDGKCYCKSHAPEGAVHITKSQFKWELEAKKAREGNDASPQVRHRTRRIDDQHKLRRIHQAARAAGLVKPSLMTTQDWNTHLKNLVKSGELTLPEPVVEKPPADLELEQDAIVATPEPVVEEPTPFTPPEELQQAPPPEPEYVQRTDGEENPLCILTEPAARDGVWIDGIKFIPETSYALDDAPLIQRINELEQAINDYCDGDLTRNDLKDVADRG